MPNATAKLKAVSRLSKSQFEMPHNLEVEETILGAILLDKSAFKIANRILSKQCFYKDAHKSVWNAFEQLDKKMNPIDLVSVVDKIQKSGLMISNIKELESKKQDSTIEKRKKSRLRKFGLQPTTLVDMTNRVASAANLEYHCTILYQLFMRREAISESYNTIKKASDLTADIYTTYDSVAKNFRSKNPQNVLTFKSMTDTMVDGAKEPPALRIAGTLVHENSVNIIFGDAGTGKTILAMQIGDAASRGKNLFGDKEFTNATKPKKVVLFDFEMESSELFKRYSYEEKSYEWHKNFYRCGINPDFLDFDEADTLITNEMQLVIEEQKPELVIIDNITYISSESQDPKIATKLMKKLLAIQKRAENQLTLIVIAHTPKRDPSLPIEARHLAGAKSLSNFAKTIIAISKSKKDPYIRYVKQLKCRQDEEHYGQDNVIVCAISKNLNNGTLEYEFKGFGKEVEHLVTPDIEKQIPAILEECLQLRKEGKSWRQLSDYIKTEHAITMTHTTVMRKVKELAYNALTEKSELSAEQGKAE